MLHDHVFDTHTRKKLPCGNIWLFADVNKLDTTKINREYAKELLRMWESHRFDLLGSGWIRCGFIDNAPGIESRRYSAMTLEIDKNGKWLEKVIARRNVVSAKKVYKMVSPEYQPVDWQKDFKSGFRWDAKKWFRFIEWADKPGGDIKVPWELSRLQHLPRMAVFAEIFPDYKEKIAVEFQNQCLDFIVQNPPRMGVNWKCTMDVGIRAANMALAYSLFCTGGCKFDDSFNGIFLTSIYEHCRHIFTNLEGSIFLKSNHYLADITGLLFGAALLSPSAKQRKWLAFAQKEVKKEIVKQFHAEGSNFEGSTAYHRLSGDMAAYAMALISNIEKQSAKPKIANRLYGAAKFLETITRPDNQFSQIGDNDSGLFFRLSPTGKVLNAQEAKRTYASLSGYVPEQEGEFYLDENMNDGRPTISALSGLFEKVQFSAAREQYPLEYSLIRALCNGNTTKNSWQPLAASPSTLPLPVLDYHNEREILSEGVSLLSGLQSITFPMFGLYIFRSDNMYLLINASDIGQKGNGGHSHNDKLSFELFINGKAMSQDYGTFVYTALPELRNVYRSVDSHNTVHTGIEQNEFINLFSMENQSRCTLLSVSQASICLVAEYRGIIHRRKWLIENDKIIIIDDCNREFGNFITSKNLNITAGYGKLIQTS